jgi:hypothetical protein
MCSIAYVVKWLFTQHLKKVHNLVAKKSKPNHPSICEKGTPLPKPHLRMNAHISNDVHVVKWWNNQKAIIQASVEAHVEHDFF